MRNEKELGIKKGLLDNAEGPIESMNTQWLQSAKM